jgi:hypothetical protein
MNKQQLIGAIRNPHRMDGQTLEQLKVTLDEYPFFQVGRMLLIKNLHLLDHIKYNNELKLAAAHISDRGRLFELLKSFNGKPEVNNTEPESTLERHVIPEETASSDSPVIKEQLQESTSSALEYFEVNDIYKSDEETETDFSFRFEQQEDDENEEIRYAYPDEEENIILPSADFLDYEVSGNTGYQLNANKSNEIVDESRSFSDWLNILKQQPVPKITDKNEPEVAGKDTKMSLIDNFLERGTKSRLRVPRDENGKNEIVDISVKSLQESDDLMTETLANIYIRQKHFLKAIDIFERLRLKYPEKNIYFARRIKELEEQFNNQ